MNTGFHSPEFQASLDLAVRQTIALHRDLVIGEAVIPGIVESLTCDLEDTLEEIVLESFESSLDEFDADPLPQDGENPVDLPYDANS
jgi:hypothetical protein